MGRPARFNKKSFFSFTVLFIWIILILTGIVLYFSPPGRIAHWVEWRFLGLTKEGWQSIHTNLSFLFVLVGALHLYYNWTIFWSYLRSKLSRSVKMGRELLLSSLVVLSLLVLMVINVPPFRTVMNFGETLSDSWGNPETEPPIPHAELFTVPEFAEETNQNLSDVLILLQKMNVQGLDTLATLQEIAARNEMSPRDLAEAITPKQKSSGPTVSGSGYGRLNLEQICRELQLDKKEAVCILQSAGIHFNEQDNIKSIASENDMMPVDIVNLLKTAAE